MSRIDRALVSLDWEDHFGNVSQRVPPWVIQTIVHFCWKLVFVEVVVPLNLRICGWKLRDLLKEFSNGGLGNVLWALQGLFWPKN